MNGKSNAKCKLLLATLMAVSVSGCQQEQSKLPSVSGRWISITAIEDVPAEDGMTAPKLSERDFIEITDTIPKLEIAVMVRNPNASATYNGGSYDITLCATLPEIQFLLADADAEIAAGRFFDNRDGSYGHPVVVVSHEFAEKISPDESPLDKTLKIGETQFKIIGILAKPRNGFLNIDYEAYISANPLHEPMMPDPVKHEGHEYPSPALDRIWLKVTDVSTMDATTQVIQALLERNHPTDQFAIEPTSK